jgi:hypothetical protein
VSIPKPYQPYQFYHSRVGNRHIAKADLLRDLEGALDLIERQIDPLSAPTVLAFLDDNDIPDKAIKYAHPNFYYLDRSSTAPPDGLNVVATATNNGRWILTTSGGLSPAEHEFLRTLNHEVVENTYTAITRTAGLVTNVTVWMTPVMLLKHRSTDITRTLGLVSQITERQFDTSGSLLYTLTHNVSRTGSQVTSLTTTRT